MKKTITRVCMIGIAAALAVGAVTAYRIFSCKY